MEEHKEAILVGHSYGGAVVIKMAIDYPELVKGIIVVAGSVDPELEKTKWIQIPPHYKILSWAIPGFLYSMNEEILALKKELQKMEAEWKYIHQPVSIIQGGKDTLVPEANADYAKKMLTNASTSMVVVPEMNHFVPWNNPGLIKSEIEKMSLKLDF